jgi:hypothetical protein
MCHRSLLLCLLASSLIACGSDKTPTSPSASEEAAQSPEVAGAPNAIPAFQSLFDSPYVTAAVAFPDRSEPYAFRLQLEGVYRDTLRAPLSPTFVNEEGAVVWTVEYIRYRLTGCSQEDTINKVMSGIDNLASPPQPDCGGDVPFPPRDEAVGFRKVALEAKYRDGLRAPLKQLYVNQEGDVIWIMEYLRHRIGNCSHAEAVDKVLIDINSIAAGQGGSPQPSCVNVVVTGPPEAAFTVIPDAGTNVNARQCAVRAGNSENILACTFDASASKPQPGITQYRWEFEGRSSPIVTANPRLRGVSLPCGSFGELGAFPDGTTTDKSVRLTVSAASGSDSDDRPVTFVRQGPC